MKKIDKLILSSFLKLFVLTACTAFFVLLMQFFLIHFDELIGKGLGFSIYAQLASYVVISATKQAFPLAILLSSIMAMGVLGERNELTALKSAGISLYRVLSPLFGFVLLITLLAFSINSYLAPRVYSDALDLMFDLGKKKPSLAIKEGVFYNKIPGYSIKVRKKLSNQEGLQGIMIYDHTKGRGSASLTMAKSGKLYTIEDESYLVMELFDGYNYLEKPAQDNLAESNDISIPQFYRSSFKTQKLVFNLESFKLTRSQKEKFKNHYRTKNAFQLAADTVAMKAQVKKAQYALQSEVLLDSFHADSFETTTTIAPLDLPAAANILQLKADSGQINQNPSQEKEQRTTDPSEIPQEIYKATDLERIYKKALEQTKNFREEIASQVAEQVRLKREIVRHELEWHKMIAWTVACVVVFFLGAPLGAVVSKGGLGIPLLIATAFVVCYYLFDMLGEKWAITSVIDTLSGAWLANGSLSLFGVFFSIQASSDVRILEADFYAVLLDRTRKYVLRASSLFRRFL